MFCCSVINFVTKKRWPGTPCTNKTPSHLTFSGRKEVELWVCPDFWYIIICWDTAVLLGMFGPDCCVPPKLYSSEYRSSYPPWPCTRSGILLYRQTEGLNTPVPRAAKLFCILRERVEITTSSMVPEQRDRTLGASNRGRCIAGMSATVVGERNRRSVRRLDLLRNEKLGYEPGRDETREPVKTGQSGLEAKGARNNISPAAVISEAIERQDAHTPRNRVLRPCSHPDKTNQTRITRRNNKAPKYTDTS